MTEAQRAATPEVDYRPFIIADADTGHGGDAHVRNLVRRFVEVGVPGYHIEDQKPGVKKCGHQGGKVLVAEDEQIKRLNAARFQLDVMKVPGIIVARTDAEAATFLDSRSDERDQPFILGATNLDLPAYKVGYVAILRRLRERGVDVRGDLLFQVSDVRVRRGVRLAGARGRAAHDRGEPAGAAPGRGAGAGGAARPGRDALPRGLAGRGQPEDVPAGGGGRDPLPRERGRALRARASRSGWPSRTAPRSTPRGRGRARWASTSSGTARSRRRPRATTRCRAGSSTRSRSRWRPRRSPTCSGWRRRPRTCTTPGASPRRSTREFPDKMLAYNLSPSFNWDTTGMSDEQMARFPEELGKLGFVFNFITYGGHQIDGLAAEEFATALRAGRHALAGAAAAEVPAAGVALPDAADAGGRPARRRGAHGRRPAAPRPPRPWARARPSTSTWCRPRCRPSCSRSGSRLWAGHHQLAVAPARPAAARTRPGSELLELSLVAPDGEKLANVIFAIIVDRRGRNILSVRDQNTFDPALRQKRLMTLDPPVPGPPLQGRVRALREPDRRQRLPGAEDEGPRAVQRGPRRGRARSSWPTVDADGVKALLAADRARGCKTDRAQERLAAHRGGARECGESAARAARADSSAHRPPRRPPRAPARLLDLDDAQNRSAGGSTSARVGLVLDSLRRLQPTLL